MVAIRPKPALRPIAGKAWLGGVRLHDLRHTQAARAPITPTTSATSRCLPLVIRTFRTGPPVSLVGTCNDLVGGHSIVLFRMPLGPDIRKQSG